MSRSMYMLKAWAPPAASVPPKTVAKINHSDGRPPSATIMVGTVVTSSNSTIRSFIKATNARIFGRAGVGGCGHVLRLRPLRQLQPAGPNVLGMFRGAISPERYVQSSEAHSGR